MRFVINLTDKELWEVLSSKSLTLQKKMNSIWVSSSRTIADLLKFQLEDQADLSKHK